MEASDITIEETVMASKKLQADDAKALLGDASTLIAMKGKKVAEYDVSKGVSEEAVNAMLGPTGNLRAPTLRTGKTYLVGFNEEVFQKTFN